MGEEELLHKKDKKKNKSKKIRKCLPSQEPLEDICILFVLNAHEEDKQSFKRILFLVESAYWYYEDNVVENDSRLTPLSFKGFTCLLFKSCEMLRPYLAHIDDIFRDFISYKSQVPVAGAIILDETYERCLLVKGWKRSSTWSFPRGKKSKDEEDYACAIREVLEETGLDVSKLLKKEEYIEFTFRGEQRVRLYIVSGVKDDTSFAPLTKKEIITGLKLYMVAPFLTSLKSWISKHPSRRPDKPLKSTCMWNAKTTTTNKNGKKLP
ncbi:hypothetical protein N665_0308s0033 [Sinapis alba]|nr:hypothetical protein N665_0308s0033 [Sinapis alba]